MAVWVVVATGSAFGPYVFSGLRTEQLIFYISALAVAALRPRQLVSALRPAAGLLAVWGVYAALAAVVGLLGSNHTKWASGSLVAGLDNLALPMATVAVVLFWTTERDTLELLEWVSWTIGVVMALNAVLAIVTCYVGSDHLPFLPHFWTSTGTTTSVASLAEGNGRFSGLFNQPAEAGIAYSLALLLVLGILRRRGPQDRVLPGILIALLIIGGLLTLSKIFIGGLAVALVLALTDRQNRRWTTLVGAVTIAATGVLAVLGRTGSWGISTMIDWYANSVDRGDSLLYTVSAGRFGTPGFVVPAPPPASGGGAEQATLVPGGAKEIAVEILHHHPWFGVGARGLQVAYDSTWVESLVVGGLVGVALMLTVHALLAQRWYAGREGGDRANWWLAGAVLTLALASSFGMPSLTGNRESTLLWICLGVLVLARARRGPGQARATTPTSADPRRGAE